TPIVKYLNGKPGITELNISFNRINAPGAKILATAQYLKKLNISNNLIGDLGAMAFAFSQLIVLSAMDCGISEEGDGVKALFLSKNLKEITLKPKYLG